MKRRHELIANDVMGRPMHVWCFGNFGAPVVAFPTAAGFAHEWDRQGMVEALAGLIDGGRIKLYCPESNVAEAWTRRDSDPAWRLERHGAYERFVVESLVPWIRADCHSADMRLAVTGASLGAFYAANFALKFPETFRYALCLSGRYDMAHFGGGSESPDLYFNNPLAYVANLDGDALERVCGQTHLTLVCGQGAWEEGCIEETNALADLLERKGIPHARDIWGHDVSHDWPWWRRQAVFHLRNTFARQP